VAATGNRFTNGSPQSAEVGRLSGSTVVIGWGLGVALVVLTALGAAMALVGGLGRGVGRGIVTAAARAVLQLAVVSAVIVAVVRSLWLSAAFVLLMLMVAAATSARRITDDRSGLLAVVPIAAGAAIVLAIVLLTGVVPPVGIAVVPIGGIVLGGAMTATSLAGRRALDELDVRRGEYEAALALGLLERDAALLVTQPSAAQALMPAMDQTRTVGLVTLPGAFVGVLLGSGDPLQAAAAQVLVLVGLLAAEGVAVVATVELVARGRIRRVATSGARPAWWQRRKTRTRARRLTPG
jgi:putative ABC transport system permease protein